MNREEEPKKKTIINDHDDLYCTLELDATWDE